MQPYTQPTPPPRKNRRKRHLFGLCIRWYLMVVGACTTIFALALLIVHLLVEVEKWMPPKAAAPIAPSACVTCRLG